MTDPFTFDVQVARIDDLLRHAAKERLARQAGQGGALRADAFDVVDNDSVTVFGSPGRITRRLLDQIWAAGVRVTVNASQLGGFHRLTVG